VTSLGGVFENPGSTSTQFINWAPELVSATDYYPGGSIMPGRSFSSDNYRYGYQGSEKDDEISGEGNNITTEFRQLDTRLLRWWSIDPKVALMPWQSPYLSMDGNPVMLNDPKGDCPKCPNGKEIGAVHYWAGKRFRNYGDYWATSLPVLEISAYGPVYNSEGQENMRTEHGGLQITDESGLGLNNGDNFKGNPSFHTSPFIPGNIVRSAGSFFKKNLLEIFGSISGLVSKLMNGPKQISNGHEPEFSSNPKNGNDSDDVNDLEGDTILPIDINNFVLKTDIDDDGEWDTTGTIPNRYKNKFIERGAKEKDDGN
jgi:hypothetical protein